MGNGHPERVARFNSKYDKYSYRFAFSGGPFRPIFHWSRETYVRSCGFMTATNAKKSTLTFPAGNHVWLTVCRTPAVERESKSWWCLPKTALAGDWLVFYEVGKGLVRIERATTAPFRREARCQEAGLLTVETEVIGNLALVSQKTVSPDGKRGPRTLRIQVFPASRGE